MTDLQAILLVLAGLVSISASIAFVIWLAGRGRRAMLDRLHRQDEMGAYPPPGDWPGGAR